MDGSKSISLELVKNLFHVGLDRDDLFQFVTVFWIMPVTTYRRRVYFYVEFPFRIDFSLYLQQNKEFINY